MQQPPETVSMKPIGVIRSCFPEKFGIPRQAGLIKEARATVEFYPEFSTAEAVRELDGFSHVWVIFLFHESVSGGWKPTVRPPRLGGNKKAGVFASRSPFRPNPIGLSAVRLDWIEQKQGQILLHLSGIDLLDNTPVLDIKPYIPYSDSITDAVGGFAPEAPKPVLKVIFTDDALTSIDTLTPSIPDLKKLITRVIESDPRPAYSVNGEADTSKTYGFRLYDLDIKWTVKKHTATVVALEPDSP